jgi:hypothetical protein
MDETSADFTERRKKTKLGREKGRDFLNIVAAKQQQQDLNRAQRQSVPKLSGVNIITGLFGFRRLEEGGRE